jgi:phosphonate transport system ATP-binding protein
MKPSQGLVIQEVRRLRARTAEEAFPSMSDAAVLSIRNVSKTFGARRALDRVSLDVARGEMIALIGPSGSGKSTLLRSISALQTIDAGEGRVEAFGGPVQENGRIAGGVRNTRTRIGMIFQQFNLVGRLSLFSNVALGSLGRIDALRGVFGLWPKETKDAAMAALARVGVADYAAQRANTLSGGQQQQAKVILADEPVASLDPVSARRVMESLRSLNRDDGLTVVVTLHQVDYAMRYCDRVVALKAGKIVYDGPAEGLKRDRLIDIYGPEFEDVFWEGAPK